MCACLWPVAPFLSGSFQRTKRERQTGCAEQLGKYCSTGSRGNNNSCRVLGAMLNQRPVVQASEVFVVRGLAVLFGVAPNPLELNVLRQLRSQLLQQGDITLERKLPAKSHGSPEGSIVLSGVQVSRRGRWVEKTTPWTTLVSLCPSIIGLQCSGSSSLKNVTFPYKCSMQSTLCQLRRESRNFSVQV